MRHFEITIMEKGGAVLHPSYEGSVDGDPRAFLVKFFGLEEPDVESYEITEKCCLCGGIIEGYGNNAAPLKDGDCCDVCNATRVVPERIKKAKGL